MAATGSNHIKLNEVRRLPLTDRPKMDESLIGFITRLTEMNNYERISWLLAMTGRTNNTSGTSSIRLDKLVDLQSLSELSGSSLDELKLLEYSRAGQDSKYLIFGNPLSKHLLRPSKPKVCSMCLRDSNYYQKIWDVVPVTACPIHRTLLIDTCPKCESRISWYRRYVSICKCQFDWRDITACTIEDAEVEISRQIYRLCGLQSGEHSLNQSIESSPLSNLELEHLIAALFFIGSQFIGIMDIKGKKMASRRQNLELHSLINRAFHVFKDWPRNYYSFLDWRRGHRNEARYVRGLRKDFGEYDSQFYKEPFLSHLKFLREEFENYLITYWEGGYTAHIKRINQAGGRHTKYVSRNEAARILRINKDAIDSFLELGILKGAVRKEAQTRFILIERNSLLNFKQELEQSLSLNETMKLLAVTSKLIMDLTQCGLLDSLQSPAIKGCSRWRFRRQEVEDLLNTISKSVIQEPEQNASKLISLTSAYKYLSRTKIGLGQLIQSTIRGEIHPRRETTAPGLQRFLFSKEDMVNYLYKQVRLAVGEVYSIPETAKLLNIPDLAVLTLIQKRILPARQGRPGHPAVWLARKEDIDSFKSNYISLAELASQNHTTASHLLVLLTNRGIQPAIGPRIAGSYGHFFRRSDITALPDIVRSARAKSASESKNGAVVSAKQAANSLGMSGRRLRQLVESGVVKPMKKQGRDHADCFSTHTLEKYKKQNFDYNGLVSSTVAAKMLGENVSKFHQRYVHAGRLVAVKAQGKRSNLYFKRKDVEALVKLKKGLIRSREAAELLNVHPSCIYKLTVAGKLRPVRGPSVDGFMYNFYLRSDIEKLRRERSLLL